MEGGEVKVKSSGGLTDLRKSGMKQETGKRKGSRKNRKWAVVEAATVRVLK